MKVSTFGLIIPKQKRHNDSFQQIPNLCIALTAILLF